MDNTQQQPAEKTDIFTPEFLEAQRAKGRRDSTILKFYRTQNDPRFNNFHDKYSAKYGTGGNLTTSLLNFYVHGTTKPNEEMTEEKPVDYIQYAGREMGKGSWKDLARTAADVLPTAGMLLGGTVGAGIGLPLSPLSAGMSSVGGGAIGAGIGSSVGQQGQEAIYRLIGDKKIEQTPADISGELKRTGQAGLEGVASELIAGGMAKGVRMAAKTPMGAAVKRYLGETLPSKFINRILVPASKEFSFMKNPGQSVVEEGIVAPTKGALKEAIIAKKTEVGDLLRTTIEAASKGGGKKVINLEPSIVGPINEAMLSAKKRGETALYNSLVDLKDGLTKEFVEEGGTIVAKGPKSLQVVPLGAWEEKQVVGDGIRWTGQAFDTDLNQVKLKIFSNIKNELVKAVPEAKDLLRRYANLIGAQHSIDKQLALLNARGLSGVRSTGLGAVMGLGSYLTGDSPAGATMKGITATALMEALGSTPSRTISAQIMKQIPRGISAVIKAMQSMEPAEKALMMQFIRSVDNSGNSEPQENNGNPTKNSKNHAANNTDIYKDVNITPESAKLAAMSSNVDNIPLSRMSPQGVRDVQTGVRLTGMAKGGIVKDSPVLVGEEGPEIVELPEGSKVIPADETKERMDEDDSGEDDEELMEEAEKMEEHDHPEIAQKNPELISQLVKDEMRDDPVGYKKSINKFSKKSE